MKSKTCEMKVLKHDAFTYMHKVHFIHKKHAKNLSEDIHCRYLNLFDM